MEPADGGTVAGVAERLELVVPGLAEQPGDARPPDRGLAARWRRGAAAARSRSSGTMMSPCTPVIAWKMPSSGVDAVALALGAGAGLLGDLEAQVHPAAQRGGQLGRRARLGLPRQLGAPRARRRGLRGPVQGDAHAEDTRRAPTRRAGTAPVGRHGCRQHHGSSPGPPARVRGAPSPAASSARTTAMPCVVLPSMPHPSLPHQRAQPAHTGTSGPAGSHWHQRASGLTPSPAGPAGLSVHQRCRTDRPPAAGPRAQRATTVRGSRSMVIAPAGQQSLDRRRCSTRRAAGGSASSLTPSGSRPQPIRRQMLS